MTGHNHYANCTCGWCVNYGGRRIDRSQVAADLPRRDARLLLERHAVRTVSACFVNPNARCPVCGEAVFFYANSHGSRVYFDELGHPWTKHPCTDNPRRRTERAPIATAPPVRRARGLAQELFVAAGTAGLFAEAGHAGADWQLMVVVSADGDNGRQSFVAESLASGDLQRAFTYQSATMLIAPGDFVSVKGDVISFLHPETLTHMNFRDGAVIVTREESGSAKPAPQGARPAVLVATSRTRPIKGRAPEKPSNPEMTQAETAHFHSKKINVAQLCDRLSPVVKSYARSGTRKPPDVAVRLNKDGHRTAAGAPWTPRLVRFLLALIFNESPPPKHDGKAARVPPRRPPPVRSGGPLTADDIASRLSALGRVTVRDKDKR